MLAWLGGGDDVAATCTEVQVGRFPILRTFGHLAKAIKVFTGVLVSTWDLDKAHALVSLFVPPTAIHQAKMIVCCLLHGFQGTWY